MDIKPTEVSTNSLSAIEAAIIKQNNKNVLDGLKKGTPEAFKASTLGDIADKEFVDTSVGFISIE
jgi:hypothetical protein